MKYVLITGASSGIGFETAKSFAHLGKNLILVARRLDRLEELKKQIKAIDASIDVILRVVDLSIPQNVLTLYQNLKKYDIEVLINNAGFGLSSSLADADIDRIREMLHVNIEALTILSTLYVKDYEQIEGAQIINISSVGGYKLVANAINYCATKFFVSAFTEGLYAELIARGAKLKAKILAPAATATEFFSVATNTEVDMTQKFPYHDTAQTMANHLISLYQSDYCLGFVDRNTYEFSLTYPKIEFWQQT